MDGDGALSGLAGGKKCLKDGVGGDGAIEIIELKVLEAQGGEPEGRGYRGRAGGNEG